jgi:putative alpha-1,2-mannosidase
MGDTETYDDFIMRAQYYKNIYDPETGFMRAKTPLWLLAAWVSAA